MGKAAVVRWSCLVGKAVACSVCMPRQEPRGKLVSQHSMCSSVRPGVSGNVETDTCSAVTRGPGWAHP